MSNYHTRIQLIATVLVFHIASMAVLAQGTAFTYQGRLSNGINPANGSYDLRFILYNSDVGGSEQGPILTNAATPVNNGLFTVALDFANVFDGNPRWLEIWVRTNGTGSFTPLVPRQSVTPAPYAITAGNVSPAALAGSFSSAVSFTNSANNFAGTFIGNGAGLTNVSATTLGGLSASNFWKLNGNAGTTPGVNFLGTTDNQPLELRANGQRALLLQSTLLVTNSTLTPGSILIFSNSPNVLGGSIANVVDPGIAGSFIGGGGIGGYYYNTGTVFYAGGTFSNQISADFATLVGGYANLIQTDAFAATIVGGAGNSIQTNGLASIIVGGSGNTIHSNGTYSVIGGGDANSIYENAAYATISGGSANRIREDVSYATIGGGFGNTCYDDYTTIPGGSDNQASGQYSFAAGRRAFANSMGAFVWADSTDAEFASTGANQFLIRAGGGVGIGTTSPATQLTVGGEGAFNSLTAAAIVLKNTASGHNWEWHALDDGRMQFADGASTKMIIDNSGNVSATSFNPTSDRNAKENFQPVSPLEILQKVAELPLTMWNFKGDSSSKHVGPMAQDFYAAFGVGMDDRHIATVDADGVALAAIKGLNLKLEKQATELKSKDEKLSELQERVAALEKLIRSQSAKETQ